MDKRPKELSKYLQEMIFRDNLERFKNQDISEYNKQEILNYALKNECSEIAEYLIENYKDLNLPNTSEFYILHYFHLAVVKSKNYTLKFCVEKPGGLDVNKLYKEK
uniref:hypothetical protein n=1 Tax=Wolbachia endosymbiont of Pentidionis agamae TaxID=3110435 RepID=UPI002FD1C11B